MVVHRSVNPRWWTVIFWWGVTVVTLILLDDLLFGPAFWALAQVDRVISTVTAFGLSLIFQLWVIRAGVARYPGRLARFFLNRLLSTRAIPQVAEREAALHRLIGSLTIAVVTSVVVGGVIPILLLHRQGMLPSRSRQWMSVMTSGIYAVEFALIHGGYGIGGLLEWMI